MSYVFILGRNPQLSIAEIVAVMPQAKIVNQTTSFLILDSPQLDCQAVLEQLGGTIKIGQILDIPITAQAVAGFLAKNHQSGKLKFGLSYYDGRKDKLGMEIKRILKSQGISCRLLISPDNALSSVVVSKNKAEEFLILQNKQIAKTCAIQDFESFSQRDFGRPQRDIQSGSMPPKLAKIMINLSGVKSDQVLLDPFCGSGTILQEALLMGIGHVIGSDNSQKAVDDSRVNLEWLEEKFEIPASAKASAGRRNSKFEIYLRNVEDLETKIKQVDTIVTEPYLGPALRGHENKQEIEKNVKELETLYGNAIEQFSKVLQPGGKVVMVIPHFTKFKLSPDISSAIKKHGFRQVSDSSLVYSRPDQRVVRKVVVLTHYAKSA